MSAHEDASDAHDDNGKMSETKPESTIDRNKDSASASLQQKRKASSPTPNDGVASKSPKRTRVDNEKVEDGSEPSSKPTREVGPDRREILRQEEKKRGRRLLGGLMSTLSQANAGSQNRKRQDIERRQQTKPTQQRAEDDRVRLQKLAKLEAVRKVEQLKFEERVMHAKHTDMLAKARYLQTRAEPKIYYLPWELTKTQEETIKDQIQQAEKIIEKEVSDFKQRKERQLGTSETAVKPPISEKHETVGKSVNIQPPTDKPQPESTNPPPSRATNKVGTEKDSYRAEDEMIEEDEDTVIY